MSIIILAICAFLPQVKTNALEALQQEIKLYDSPNVFFVSDPLADKTVQAGSEVELSCTAGGVPQPVVYWTFNGKRIGDHQDGPIYEQLHNSGKLTIQNGLTIAKLTIPCATKKQRGKYRCVASNGFLHKDMSMRLSVVGHVKTCSSEPQPPSIVMATDARFEFNGNSAQLFCRSQPGVQVAWYFDRLLLNNRKGYELLPNGDLIIHQLEWSHMGRYTCVVSNEIGEDRYSLFLYPNKHDDPPEEKK